MIGNRDSPFRGTAKQTGNCAICPEGRETRQKLVKNQSYGEKVGALVQILGQCLLRGHVVHGPEERAGLGHAVAFNHACQPEIHDQNAAAPIGHNVLWLQVAVDDACAVRCLQGSANLLDDVHRLFGS